MSLTSTNISSLAELLFQKTKTLLLLAVFTVSSLNVFAQTPTKISDCSEFVTGTNASWPYVLEATTVAAGVSSQAAQTFTMNITTLPTGGADVRVYKTTANGSAFFATPQALTLGSNTVTVAAVSFNRAVKFQFSSGDVEFDALTLNGVASSCVAPTPPPTTSLISDCGDFVTGTNASWPYILEATTVAAGVSSQAAQTFTMNITTLPAGGADVRVYKTTANGSAFFATPQALTLGSNTITVAAVSFNRAVKFQFSSGAVEFDALSLNGVASSCVAPTPPPTTSLISDCGDFVSGPTAWPYVLEATTVAAGASSQGAQTFTMNITNLPAGGANVRVAKTTANGNWFFGNPVALGINSITINVAAVSFNRAVKFQFSSGAVEFDALSLNGVASTCVGSVAPPVSGCTDSTATNYDPLATVDDGSCTYPAPPALALQGILDFTVPSGGSDGKAIHVVATDNIADLSVYGIGVANNGGGTDGQEYTFDAISVSTGDDILVVRSVSAMSSYFDACYTEFDHVLVGTSSISQNGDDAIELFYNGNVIETFGDINVDGTGQPWEYMDSWAYKDASGTVSFSGGNWIFGGVNCTDGSTTTYDSGCPYPLCPSLPNVDCNGVSNGPALVDSCGVCQLAYVYNFVTHIPTYIGDTTGVVLGPTEILVLPNSPTNPNWNSSCSGCTDSTATNYDPSATIDDGSCIACVYGCTDSTALNYDALATCDDGSCSYSPPPVSSTSLISDCGDFVSGPAAWPYVLVATTTAAGASSQGAQTFTMNITNLPAGGANVRVAKTTANGNWFLANPVALALGPNSVTVPAVSFNRSVKFQFSSGAVEFDDLTLNGVTSTCVGSVTPVSGCTDSTATNYDPLATVDDGSCTYPPPPVLTITTTVCDTSASEVRLTGPWWSWNPMGGPVAADNGDGTWTFTFNPAPTADMEYLLVVDGVQEDMVASGNASGNWSCTPITDYWSYANRLWTVGSGDVTGIVYGTCDSCVAAPAAPPALSLQGVLDFTVPSGGSDGKAIHVVATDNIADLSVYGIGVANNGGGTDGQEYTFDAISVSSGDHILVARSVTAMTAYFDACYSEFDHVLVATTAISQNGDDAIELFYNGNVIETFGDINVDGTGTAWDYMDSWGYKDSSGTVSFSGGNWIFGGVNCTDGSTTTFNSTCPYPLCPFPGCTDPTATNYNPFATSDDGSCTFACTAAPYSENFDASIGTFSNAGWVWDAGGTTSGGTGPSDDVTGGGYYMYYETSSGYSPDVTLTYECLDISTLTNPALRFYYHMYGATIGTLDVTVNGDTVWSLAGDQGDQWYQAQVDLSAYAGTDITVAFIGAYGGSYTGDMALDNIEVDELATSGCTDTAAANYDPLAGVDDGSCQYPGCTDPFALNFDPGANVDDGSCTYPACNALPFVEDWETNTFATGNWLTSAGAEANVELDSSGSAYGMSGTYSVEFTGGNFVGWLGGSSTTTSAQAWSNTDHISSATVCVDMSGVSSTDYVAMTLDYNSLSYFGSGAYSWFRVLVDGVVISDITGANEWFAPGLLNLEFDLSAYAGLSPNVTLQASCKYGDVYAGGAYNDYVWVDNINISVSTPTVTGCTDPNYANYDPLATVDDGSCAGCLVNSVTITMYDSWGDGWNGNMYTITDSTGAVVATGTLATGSFGVDTLCLPDGCYDITVGGGSFPSEVSFDFGTLVGAPVGTYTGQCFPAVTLVYGCTDPNFANYDPAANVDDGSCSGCLHNEVALEMFDSFGDGWNGSTYTVTDASGNVVATGGLLTGSYGVDTLCLPDGCYDITVGGGSWTSEVSFNFVSLSGAGVGTYTGICVPGVYGCTDPTALNYDSTATIDDGSCIAIVYGCTDSTATNYYAGANVDDGSCLYGCSSPITNLGVTDIIHNRATFTFDDMNTSTCRVDQLRIKYREVGTTAWSQKNMGSPTGYDPVTGICNSTSRTDKLVLGLSANTTYEWEMRVWYCSTGATAWVNGPNFTTLADCPNVGNLAVTTTNTKATFTWDDSNGAYSFVRLQARVDTTGSSFFNIGGVGVPYGTYTKDKYGLVPGTSYRAKSRTWCDPNGGAYKAPSWTTFIYFTMPGSVRLDGGVSIDNLDVYPNPSRDIFNVSFTSEDAQDLEVRVINVVGEVVYTENLMNFTGEFTKEIDLRRSTKGIYFLEITTEDGVINKKMILQ